MESKDYPGQLWEYIIDKMREETYNKTQHTTEEKKNSYS